MFVSAVILFDCFDYFTLKKSTAEDSAKINLYVYGFMW